MLETKVIHNKVIMTHIPLSQVQDFVGFSVENSEKGEQIKVLSKGSFTSDQKEFYNYTEQISNIFLNRADVLINGVYQFLVIIHKDLSADLYINNFPVRAQIIAKREIQKGEKISQNDIADISKLDFQGIVIEKTDKIIYCFKVGWKFALFFDLDRRHDLEIDNLQLELGTIYRYLQFQYVYNVLESETQFNEIISDGWFPFIEIIGGDYKKLSEFYQNKFNFDNNMKKLIDSFDQKRIEKIMNKWWNNIIFKDKQPLIEAGIKAYLQDDESGFINCIKNLSSEIEGIVRLHHLDETGKGRVNFSNLMSHLINKGKDKSGSDYSLFLPVPFLKYLKDVFFVNFDLVEGNVKLSRHSSSHGVAKSEDYKKLKALQTILTLDQVYFYLS
ncbi:MAG: hypothetical protein KAT05_00965 [Spirochaetes bacterium]|nr:hypothetical protein [Spirochaetota bacterium]